MLNKLTLIIIILLQNNFVSSVEEESKVQSSDLVAQNPLSENAKKIINQVREETINKYNKYPTWRSECEFNINIMLIEDGSLNPIFDFLVTHDRDGNNLEQLEVILKTGRVNINKTIVDFTNALAVAINFKNYPLFEFLINQGAEMTELNKSLLGELIKQYDKNGYKEWHEIMLKMFNYYNIVKFDKCFGKLQMD